jgi:hydrogenase/urease accessory protein HupE
VDAGVSAGAAPSVARRGIFVRAALGLVTALLAAVGVAHAHAPLLSQSEFEWEGPATVRAAIVFAWQDAAFLAKVAQSARALPLAPDGGTDAFEEVVRAGVEVSADGKPCPGRLEKAEPYAGDGFLFAASFRCPDRPTQFRVRLPLLRRLGPEHRHLMRLFAGGGVVQTTLFGSQDTAEIAIPEAHRGRDADTDRSRAAEASSRAPFGRTLRDALKLGVRHILTGWDHVLFLLGIALGARTLRSVVLPITAFTLAHSITLLVASFGVLTLSPRIVEPAIAASIAYVAFENLALPTAPSPVRRSQVTFLFGLLHGFGFARALTDLALGRDRLLPTLLGFNLGVEMGQLALLVVALPLVLFVEAKAGTRATRAVCGVIGVVGVGLFIQRLGGVP